MTLSLPPVPPALDAHRALGSAWGTWLDRLPARAAEVVEEWALTVDGEAWHGFCSLVLPVHTEDGTPAALKLTWDGDEESEHEHLALRRWAGDGAVRLLRADPARRALLLERADRRDLSEEWDLAACETVGDLYGRLHVPAPPQLRPVTAYVERWNRDLVDRRDRMPMPPRLIERAVGLAADLIADPASVGTLIHGDLHYENVLAADRPDDPAQPWLVIDPKPMSGDPHYEPAPMLWNRWGELAHDARGGVRRRFEALLDAGGLDEARARAWVIVRMVHNASWTVLDAEARGRALDADDRAWITRCVTIAKAVEA